MDDFAIERVERQIELNDKMKALGDRKYDKNADRVAKIGGFGETKGGMRSADAVIAGFIQTLDNYLVNAVNTHRARPILVKKLVDKASADDISYRVNPSVVCRIALKSVMNSLVRPADKRISVTTVATLIGRDLEYAIKTVVLDTQYEGLKQEKMEMLKRQGLLGDEDEIRKVLEELSAEADIEHEPWSNKDLIAVGYVLLVLLAKAPVFVSVEGMGDEKQEVTFGDFFLEDLKHSIDFKTGLPKSKKTFKISEQGVKWLEENEDFLKGFSFSFLPMVIAPMPWTFSEENGFKGGYYDPALFSRYPLMKNVGDKTLKDLCNEHPDGFNILMATLNAAQEVPFRINETVFNAVNWVNDNQIQLDKKGIPAYKSGYVEYLGSEEVAQEYFDMKKQLMLDDNNHYLPESRALKLEFARRVVAGSATATDEEVFKAFRKMIENIAEFNRAEKSKKLLINNVLIEAEQFLDEAIYFCYNADFRGRIYPIAGQFQPQGSDTSKGMLEFAEAVKVENQEAVDMIAFQIANSWGEDKCSIEKRIEWTNDNTDKILQSAEDFAKYHWWMEADKPFLFLLGCLEWQKYHKAKEAGTPFDFETTLPIAFDGSVNGIQHFSALLRDEDGAKYVNLLPGLIPADAYQVVANAALESAKSVETKWFKFIVQLNKDLDGMLFNRKVSKRAVMTTPYGVSESSAGDYILKEVDKFIRDIDMTPTARKKVRKHMKKLIWNSIKENVGAPIVAKDYLQSIALIMAQEERTGLKWFTPTGLPILQKVMEKKTKFERCRVTVDGKTIDRRYPVNSMKINLKEQANGIAPNFVHSFDSAHLQKTVVAASREGMDKFLLIHDSFATDATNAVRFNHIIREQFVDMYYQKDYLKDFQDECERQIDGKMLVKEDGSLVLPMKLGDLDVRQVLDSIYFFA